MGGALFPFPAANFIVTAVRPAPSIANRRATAEAEWE